MLNLVKTSILEHLTALADTTRHRLLLLLERNELTVSELCAVTQLPQSTVSRHLKALADSGWVTARAEGTSHLYAMSRAIRGAGEEGQASSTHRLWQLVRDEVAVTPGADQDRRRLEAALARRRARSQEFFSAAAGQWDRLRDDLFGDRFPLALLAAMTGPDIIVGDLGCGTGETTATLAPFVSRVVAVDASADMLEAASRRLSGLANVDLRCGELEALPIDDQRLDVALVTLVLHHISNPASALAEIARVLKPGGKLVLVDMLPHDRETYRQQMGHVWLGFAGDQLSRWLADTGFADVRFVPLASDPRAKGPGLFIATGTTRVTAVTHSTTDLASHTQQRGTEHVSTTAQGVN